LDLLNLLFLTAVARAAITTILKKKQQLSQSKFEEILQKTVTLEHACT
jgi:hypothetical protein